MKCGTMVLWREARKRGSGEPYRKAVRWYHSGLTAGDPASGFIPEAEWTLLERCDGPITATIQAREEPEWGGSYAALEIAYSCKKCGAKIFPHLPQDAESLSKFVTEAIGALAESRQREAP